MEFSEIETETEL